MKKDNMPFQMPKSMASYVEQYEKEPEKTISRFKKQLQRRGKDAVGYFLLGWFYFQNKENKKAVECALKAKTLAPGSPFFEKVHYYFSHPDLFSAWQSPDSANTTFVNNKFTSGPDLNSLIDKLSRVEKPIKIDPDGSEADDKRLYNDEDVKGIASETLAKVHEQQENYEIAIQMYQILKETNKEKVDFYNKKIAEIERQMSEKERK